MTFDKLQEKQVDLCQKMCYSSRYFNYLHLQIFIYLIEDKLILFLI